jgi:hypothetical protein
MRAKSHFVQAENTAVYDWHWGKACHMVVILVGCNARTNLKFTVFVTRMSQPHE